MNNRFLWLVTFLLVSCQLFAQQSAFTFAVVSDIHVGRGNTLPDIEKTVSSINANADIKFVIVTGDVTNFGTDEQLKQAKKALDGLKVKYYAIPGNHEDAWSESGGTSFKRIFGDDRFAFKYGGYFFLGTDCGPTLRHGDGYVPRNSLKWMDSVLTTTGKMPVIYANHIPITSSMTNGYEVIKKLKKVNTQLIISGHLHRNTRKDLSGIPGVICRSNLEVNGTVGYNLAYVDKGLITFTEIDPYQKKTYEPWTKQVLAEIPKGKIIVAEPDYSINLTYPNVKAAWTYEHQDDIGGGFSMDDKFLYTGSNNGELFALNKLNGKKEWIFNSGGRIFSTPAISDNRIIFGSTTGKVYCINKAGKELWTFTSERPVVSSPLIKGNRVFVGFSDGTFRCLDMQTGKIIWEFNGIGEGFVQTALLYQNNVYFGAWNSTFYALDQETGKLKWNWKIKRSYFHSPAMVSPIGVNGHIFAITPDSYINCFDAETGNKIYRENNPDFPTFFSSGLSQDSTTIFFKTVNNKGVGISTKEPGIKTIFDTPIPVINDRSPTSIPDNKELVFFSSNNGVVIAVSKVSGKIAWQHKISNAAIIKILPLDNKLYVSTNDGKVVCLKYF